MGAPGGREPCSLRAEFDVALLVVALAGDRPVLLPFAARQPPVLDRHRADLFGSGYRPLAGCVNQARKGRGERRVRPRRRAKTGGVWHVFSCGQIPQLCIRFSDAALAGKRLHGGADKQANVCSNSVESSRATIR